MKLHLPKALLSAILAFALGAGSAHALTVTVGEYTGEMFSTADGTATAPDGWTYSEGLWTYSYGETGVGSVSQWFQLDYSKLNSADQHVIYITSNGSTSYEWGINTNAEGTALTGYWSPNTNNGRYTKSDNNTSTTVDTVAGLQAIGTSPITLKFTTNTNGAGGGTYLYTNSGTTVYDGGGLSTSKGGSIASLTVDSAYVSAIGYNETYNTTVAAGDWSKTYAKAVTNTIAGYSVEATILDNGTQTVYGGTQTSLANLKNGGDIVIGGSGQLHLQTWRDDSITTGEDISLTNDIYIGTTTNSNGNGGAIRLGAWSGDISLGGTLNLVENSKITKESAANNHVVTIGKVTDGDAEYTLTLAGDLSSAKFDATTFTGDVELGGLTVAGAGGSDISFSNAEADKTVQIGTLTTQGGAHKLTFDETTTIDTLSMGLGSALSLGGTGTVSINKGTLAATLDNSNANLTINGTVSADSIFMFDSTVDTSTGYSDGENGYQQGGTFTIVDNVDGGAVTGLSQITIAGTVYDTQTSDGDVVINVAADTTHYYVNTTVDYTAGSNVAGAASVMLKGGTLNLSSALSDNATIAADASSSGTVNIGNGMSLSNASVNGSLGTVTITGDTGAVYDMGQVAFTNKAKPNVAIGENWQGTVVFAKGTSFKSQYFNLNDFGVAGSTIQFNGTTSDSYLGAARDTDGNHTYVANIELNDGGITIANGWGGSKYTFTGDFKGNGAFDVDKGNLSSGLTFTFKGDMSKWEGELSHSQGANNTYTFAAAEGKSTTIANKVTAEGGTMNVTINNTSAVTMAGDVTADGGTLNLTKTGGSKLTVNNLSAKSSNVVLTGTGNDAIEVGTMSIASGNNVTGTADVTVTSTLSVASVNALSLTGALTLGDNVTVDLTGFTVATGQTAYTLATANNGVTLQNYTLTGLDLTGTDYAGYTATLQAMPATNATMVLDGESATPTNTTLVLTLTAPATTELTEVTVTGGNYTDGVLTFTTEADLSAGLADAFNIKFDEATWQDILKANPGMASEISVALDGVNWTEQGVTKLTINGVGPIGGTLEISDDGTAAGNYVTAYIPEPTTTTLSLLALAGLAVRRRRR